MLKELYFEKNCVWSLIKKKKNPKTGPKTYQFCGIELLPFCFPSTIFKSRVGKG